MTWVTSQGQSLDVQRIGPFLASFDSGSAWSGLRVVHGTTPPGELVTGSSTVNILGVFTYPVRIGVRFECGRWQDSTALKNDVVLFPAAMTVAEKWSEPSPLLRARALLRSTRIPIAEIAVRCGFASQSAFTTRFSVSKESPPAPSGGRSPLGRSRSRLFPVPQGIRRGEPSIERRPGARVPRQNGRALAARFGAFRSLHPRTRPALETLFRLAPPRTSTKERPV